MLEEADDVARPFEVADADRRLEPVAVDLEPARVMRPARVGQGRGGRQLLVRGALVAQRQGDEPEDVAEVDLEGQVPALDRGLEPLRREPPGLIRPAVIGSDKSDAAQPPGREDVGSLPRVALAAHLCIRASGVPVPTKELRGPTASRS